MKNEYKSPEFEFYKVSLIDVILGSPLESEIGENIGDDNGGGGGIEDPISLDF